MSGKGFLLAMMEPSSSFEEEFQDWYDNEHVPERMAVPGFETGQRFVCQSGFPRYVAFYDLSSLDVLRSPAYLQAHGKGVSPWTLRVRARTYGRYRFTGTQVYPGQANLGDKGAAVRLMILRFRKVVAADQEKTLAGLKANFEGRAGVSQLRLFHGEESEGGDFLATVEFSTNAATPEVDASAFGALGRQLDLVNVYAPYWRSVYSPYFKTDSGK
jgi:hypothetical protein